MGQRGRPAKQGARYPGGQLKPRPKPDGEPVNAVVLQRLFKDATKLGVDQRLASQVGRLWCLREFTSLHAAVAFRIAGIYARFERAHGQRRTTASPSYEMGYGRGAMDDDDDAAEVERTWNDLAGEAGWMMNLLDWRLRAALEQLCVEDCAINSQFLPHLRSFFEKMAGVWGMTGKAAKATRREGGKKSGGPPLHFNAHEADKKSPAAAGQPKPPAPNIDRIYWVETMKRLRPDLDDKDLKLAYDFTSALKDRAIREQQLARARRPERVPLSQQYPVKLGKATLKLPMKAEDDDAA